MSSCFVPVSQWLPSWRILPLALLLAAPCVAAESPPLTTELSATKRTVTKDAQGHTVEAWVAFTKLLPGEEVTYTLACTNHGEQPASDLVVSLPIPAEMILAAPEATAGAETTYSIDGGNTFAPFDRLVITAPDGTTRPATREDINVTRWKLTTPLVPGATARVACRALLK